MNGEHPGATIDWSQPGRARPPPNSLDPCQYGEALSCAEEVIMAGCCGFLSSGRSKVQQEPKKDVIEQSAFPVWR